MKKKVLIVLIVLATVGTIGFVFINSNFYTYSMFFMRDKQHPKHCYDGKTIPCTRTRDCALQAMKDYCGPEGLQEEIPQLLCPSIVKCSPDKVCEVYCH